MRCVSLVEKNTLSHVIVTAQKPWTYFRHIRPMPQRCDRVAIPWFIRLRYVEAIYDR